MLTLDAILAALPSAQKNGSGWRASCPSHEDEYLSLSIDKGDKGPLLHCHHGCTFEAIRAALGLEQKHVHGTITGRRSWPIKDATGVVVATHTRLDFSCGHKSFVWDGGLDGRPVESLPLYGIDRLQGDWVVVCEGEKDADHLLSLGIPAVGTVTGAAATPSAASLAPMLGRRNVLWGDNDTIGNKHMARIAALVPGCKCIVWPDAPPKAGAADHPGPKEAILALIEAAVACDDLVGPSGLALGPSGLAQEASESPPLQVPPEVKVGHDLERMNDQAQAALLAGGGLYSHAERMVEVRPMPKSPLKWFTRAEGLPGISPISLTRSAELLSSRASWRKTDKRSGSLVACRPDPHTVAAMIDRRGGAFPPLTGITETPYLLPDGTLHAEPGYHADTGILMTGGVKISLLSSPQDAFDVLADPFCDFAFVSSHDLAAAVAAVLTVIQRDMIDGCSPLFACRANHAGTGKGLLADTISVIATGRKASKIAPTDEEEEWRKRLLTLALDAAPVVCVDNIKSSIGSAALAMALTDRMVHDRILGETRQVHAHLGCVWFSTGNNTNFKSDLARRVVPIDQESKTANPETRTGFKHGHSGELLAWCLANRSALVSAALTILSQPHHPIPDVGPLGSFEAWDSAVRCRVYHASGGIDPCETRARLKVSGDEDEESTRALYGAIADSVGVGVVFTGPELCARAENAGLLRDALGLFCPKNPNKPEPRAVGKALGDKKDTISDGLILRRELKNSATGNARYKLVTVAA